MLSSNAVLQRLDRQSLDNLARRFCFNHDNFSEDFSFPCLGSWLSSELEHAQAWNGKLASLFDFFGGNIRKNLQDFRGYGFLQLTTRRQCVGDASFAHGFDRYLLHWRHAIY